jgi:hypothetical protein
MIERVKKTIGIVAVIAFGRASAVGLAGWTIGTWDDTPFFSAILWMGLGLAAYYAEQDNKNAKTRGIL